MTLHRLYSPRPVFDPLAGIVVKEPERAEAGYWVGCPGVLYEPDEQRFLMTYRERRPRGAEPERGWRCALAQSDDGVDFTDVWEVHKDELGTSSMERFSVLPAPGGGYHLYISYVDPADNRWRVDALRADTPDGFDIATARPAPTAAGTGTEGVKDPYVLRDGPVTYLFASYAAARPFSAGERRLAHGSADIYNVGLTTHPTGLATGLDGTGFTWHGGVLGVGDGWDGYQARLNCVLPTPAGFFGLYDGSASVGENYEERCGVAVCTDLRDWRSLTPDRPWITTPHASGSVRYVDAVPVGEEWWIYYETTRPDAAHELRLAKVRA